MHKYFILLSIFILPISAHASFAPLPIIFEFGGLIALPAYIYYMSILGKIIHACFSSGKNIFSFKKHFLFVLMSIFILFTVPRSMIQNVCLENTFSFLVGYSFWFSLGVLFLSAILAIRYLYLFFKYNYHKKFLSMFLITSLFMFSVVSSFSIWSYQSNEELMCHLLDTNLRKGIFF